MNRFWRYAYLLVALGLLAGWFWFASAYASELPALPAAPLVFVSSQDPDPPSAEHSIPDGGQCFHQTPGWTVDFNHTCECQRTCYYDEMDPPQMHIMEDPRCKWYCKKDKCGCGFECELDGEGK